MKEKLTITDVEKRIDAIEDLLLQPTELRTFLMLTNRLRALNIKLCAMKGESPVVLPYKPEYII